MNTFDLKPDHANGREFKPIATAVPGLHFSEHLPKLAARAAHLTVVRSMSTKEGDHGRATHFLRTGYMPQGQVQYPTLGSLLAKEMAVKGSDLPAFVSIAPYRFYDQASYGPGFLGHDFAPLIVGEHGRSAGPGVDGYGASLKVKDIELPVGLERRQDDARIELLDRLNTKFLEEHPGELPLGHRTAFERAVRLMRSDGVKAFNLDDEPAPLRDAYGRNAFGQGCLLARRLVERGVPFVEVTLDSVDGVDWDTHAQNFDRVRRLSEVLDAGWSTLIDDLRRRGLLDTTTIVWMGEFGRTPKINKDAGRDHAPNAWTAVLAGGGIAGGQAIGRTSPDGTAVVDRPVTVPDFLATVCLALGIDTTVQNISNVGRAIKIVDSEARPVKEALG